MRFLSKWALNCALENLVAFGKKEATGLNSVTKRKRFSPSKNSGVSQPQSTTHDSHAVVRGPGGETLMLGTEIRWNERV